MLRRKALLALATSAVAAALFSEPARSQDRVFSLGLSAGITGSIDEDNTGFSNPTFQARFAAETARHRNIAVRVGHMDFGEESLSQAFDVTIDYLTIGGEYLFAEAGHESGFLLGIGYYGLRGTRFDGASADEGGLGLVLGAIGEFEVTERWLVSVDALLHYTALDAAQIFASLQVGMGYRF